MSHKNSKYYWQCQLLGWGTMGLSMLFFGYIYGQKINIQFVMRIMVVVMVGIISTLTGILIIIFNEIFKLAENKSRFDFFTRLLNNSVNSGIFIIPWIMIY